MRADFAMLARRTTVNAFATLVVPEGSKVGLLMRHTYSAEFEWIEDTPTALKDWLVSAPFAEATVRNGRTGQPQPFLALAQVQRLGAGDWQTPARALSGLCEVLDNDPLAHLHFTFKVPAYGSLSSPQVQRKELADRLAATYGFNGIDLTGAGFETCGRGWSVRALLAREALTPVAYKA
jgi:hypothetical protein